MEIRKNLQLLNGKLSVPAINQYFNEKRYYVNKIRAHMMKIRNEIENLTKSSADNKVNAFWLQEDKAKATKKAKTYSELEKELTLLNIVLQMKLRRCSYEKILTDILIMKRNNEDVLEKLDEFFDFKHYLEELSTSLKSELEERNFYSALSIASPENEECKRNIEVVRRKIEKTKEAIARYRRASEQSFFRTKRRQLLLKLNAYIAEREGLLKECDPDTVLQTLRQDKEQIKELESSKRQLERDLQQLKADIETIANIEASRAEENSKDPEKVYREVRSKANTINDCLDYLLLKRDKYGEFCGAGENTFTDVTSEEVFEQHLRKLRIFGDGFAKQLLELSQTLHEKQFEMRRYKRIDEEIEELSEKGMELEQQKNSLQIHLASATTSAEALKERLRETTHLLERDQRYNELKALDAQLARLEQENLILEERLLLEKGCAEREELSKEIDELTKEYNEKLIRRLKGKFA